MLKQTLCLKTEPEGAFKKSMLLRKSAAASTTACHISQRLQQTVKLATSKHQSMLVNKQWCQQPVSISQRSQQTVMLATSKHQ